MEDGVNRGRCTAEDFVLDDAFCRWVLQSDTASDAFWTDWFARHPHQREAAKEARRLILLLTRSEEQPSAMSQGEKEAREMILRLTHIRGNDPMIFPSE